MAAFAVFVPWALLGLLISLVVFLLDLSGRIARAEFAQAVRGRRRRYAVTFINNRGY